MTRVHVKHAQETYSRAQLAEVAGDYSTAHRLYRALIRQLCSTPPQKLHVDVYRSLADSYRILGRYREADAIFAAAFKIANKVYRKNTVERWRLVNGRAILCKYSGRFAAGARLYRRALRILMNANGSYQSEIATIYHNLGGLEHARGRYTIGERLARKGIGIRLRVAGANHPAVVADEAALAALLLEQKKFDQAEVLLRRALRIFRRASQPDNYDVGIALSNLGSLQHARGNLAEALRYHKQALRIKEKLLGPYHVDVAVTLNNIAMIHCGQERRAEALPLFSRALSIMQASVSSRHPNLIKCKKNYAALLQKASRGTSRRRVDLWIPRDLHHQSRQRFYGVSQFSRKIPLHSGLVPVKASSARDDQSKTTKHKTSDQQKDKRCKVTRTIEKRLRRAKSNSVT